jgi:transcriptional regulator with XRE-family HTH domain
MHLTRCIGETTHGGGRLNGTVRIGARLRHAREAGRLSLDVEARTGLSKGFLSKGERDASSPSVANLVSICDAIGLPMADLFAVPRNELLTLTGLCRA